MNIFNYKWWWSRIGGRQWTFISRDVWHKLEYLPIVLLLFAGFFTGYYWHALNVPLIWLVALWAVSTIWYVFGHFFWGKEYVPDQGKFEL